MYNGSVQRVAVENDSALTEQQLATGTECANPDRSTAAEIQWQRQLVRELPFLVGSMNAVSDMVVVLDCNRQIVFANTQLLSFLGIEDSHEIIGMRLGEAIGCEHAEEAVGGCGTSKYCKLCGALQTILAGLKGLKDQAECHFSLGDANHQALDLKVRSTPLRVDGRAFVVIAVRDVADEHRRRALERIFFHDILNSASGVCSLSELTVAEPDENSRKDLVLLMNGASKKLIEEIQCQRDLLYAESDELQTNLVTVQTAAIIKEVVEFYKEQDLGRGKKIEISDVSVDVEITTDERILRRILSNLLKNALEASKTGDAIQIKAECQTDSVRFGVRNPAVMPPDVQLQVFKRSFSTKGQGRGLGTYSVKLLAQKYLKGKVGFDTSENRGTRFFVDLPMIETATED